MTIYELSTDVYKASRWNYLKFSWLCCWRVQKRVICLQDANTSKIGCTLHPDVLKILGINTGKLKSSSQSLRMIKHVNCQLIGVTDVTRLFVPEKKYVLFFPLLPSPLYLTNHVFQQHPLLSTTKTEKSRVWEYRAMFSNEYTWRYQR